VLRCADARTAPGLDPLTSTDARLERDGSPTTPHRPDPTIGKRSRCGSARQLASVATDRENHPSFASGPREQSIFSGVHCSQSSAAGLRPTKRLWFCITEDLLCCTARPWRRRAPVLRAPPSSYPTIPAPLLRNVPCCSVVARTFRPYGQRPPRGRRTGGFFAALAGSERADTYNGSSRRPMNVQGRLVRLSANCTLPSFATLGNSSRRPRCPKVPLGLVRCKWGDGRPG
jgi:hypothetical protein